MLREKISIITVCFNAKSSLEKTFRSICEQSYREIEYIIVDGASTDGSLELLQSLKQEYSDRDIKIISEKDNGIYDAMNKGLRLASGKYLWFINAGDFIYERYCVEKIFRKIGSEKNIGLSQDLPKIIYGKTALHNTLWQEIGEREHKIPKKLNYKSFRKGMLVCHQSILIDKSICQNYNWQKYGGCADIDWILNALKICEEKDIFNTNMFLSSFLVGGYSTKNEKKAWRERFFVMKDHYGLFETCVFHVYIIFRRIFRAVF